MRPYPYPLRWRLPYGWWECQDGRLVVFDRCYDPIAEKYPGRHAQLIDPHNWIKWVDQTWLYTDKTPEYLKNRRARNMLKSWDIYEIALARAKVLRKIPHKIASPNAKIFMGNSA